MYEKYIVKVKINDDYDIGAIVTFCNESGISLRAASTSSTNFYYMEAHYDGDFESIIPNNWIITDDEDVIQAFGYDIFNNLQPDGHAPYYYRLDIRDSGSNIDEALKYTQYSQIYRENDYSAYVYFVYESGRIDEYWVQLTEQELIQDLGFNPFAEPQPIPETDQAILDTAVNVEYLLTLQELGLLVIAQ